MRELPITSREWRFPLTALLGAFLLFQVQPMAGKLILPWFGGGPAVWTVCLLFFQTVLLLGYGYAHWAGGRLNAPLWRAAHLALLAGSLLFLPLSASANAWKPDGAAGPTLRILTLLSLRVGLPYLFLSSTGPLVQRAFHSAAGRSPFRLYALSNAGSLLALLAYPFVVEPLLPLEWQARLWSCAYAAFAVLFAWTSLGHARPGPSAKPGAGPATVLYWLSLAACGSVLLLAATNQMCREVASTPFLWILPLAIYLLTFLLAFNGERWYDRRWSSVLAGVSIPAACALVVVGMSAQVLLHLAVYSLALFACCMICHGELARAKPDPERLTGYYLIIAGGGAIGGAFVAIVAPKVFRDYTEYYLGLAACSLLALEGWRRARAWITGPVAGLALALIVALVAAGSAGSQDAIASYRNFYGILRVNEREDENGPKRVLMHGRIMHGFQYTDDDKRSWPTSYYGRDSGIGLALENHSRREGGLTVGLIGLGVGTIAAYGRPGDTFRFYEIDSDVERISERYFTYRKDSQAKIEVIIGDARVRLEQEPSGGFDVLAVDAFTSDAIPTHLVTAEALALYRRHLKPDGLVAFHITNQAVDLSPVMRGLAAHSGWQALRIFSPGDDSKGTSRSTWVLMSPIAAHPALVRAASPWPRPERPPLLWTDDFSSLWRVLRF